MFSITAPARRVLTLGQTTSSCKRLCTSSLRVRPFFFINLTCRFIRTSNVVVREMMQLNVCEVGRVCLQGTSLQSLRQQPLHQRTPFSSSRNFAVGPGGDYSAKGYSAAEAEEYEDMGGTVSPLQVLLDRADYIKTLCIRTQAPSMLYFGILRSCRVQGRLLA